jgi:hypothetical protein
LTGKFSIGSDPQFAGAKVKAVWRNHTAVPGGVDEPFVGLNHPLACLIVRPTGYESSGHSFDVAPLLGFPFVIVGLLTGMVVGSLGGSAAGVVEENVT